MEMLDKTSSPTDQPWWMCAAAWIRAKNKVEQFLCAQGDLEDQSSLMELSVPFLHGVHLSSSALLSSNMASLEVVLSMVD